MGIVNINSIIRVKSEHIKILPFLLQEGFAKYEEDYKYTRIYNGKEVKLSFTERIVGDLFGRAYLEGPVGLTFEVSSFEEFQFFYYSLLEIADRLRSYIMFHKHSFLLENFLTYRNNEFISVGVIDQFDYKMLSAISFFCNNKLYTACTDHSKYKKDYLYEFVDLSKIPEDIFPKKFFYYHSGNESRLFDIKDFNRVCMQRLI